MDELAMLITEAGIAKYKVSTSSDGADISSQEYWVTPEVMAALNTAITGATTALGGGNYDDAYKNLVNVMNSFYTNKKPGKE